MTRDARHARSDVQGSVTRVRSAQLGQFDQAQNSTRRTDAYYRERGDQWKR